MPRKTLKQRKTENTDTDFNVNRLRSVTNSIVGTEDPDDLMIEIMSVLNESGKIPNEGKYYIFVYNPKTPNIRYDQNPLVAVSNVFSWGFRGINFHWGKIRQYTWEEVVGQVYEVYKSEIKDLQTIPFGKFRLNS